MAALAGAVLPELMQESNSNPLSINNLMGLAGYEAFGKQMQENAFQQQLKLQQNSFDQFNSTQASAFTQQRSLQGNFLAQQQNLQSNFLGNQRDMQSTQVKGQLMQSGIQAGSNLLGQGFGLLGGYLNYKYASNLQAQQSSEELNNFNAKFATISNAYEQAGLPGFLAAGNTSIFNSMPRTAQVANGLNARVSTIPGAMSTQYQGTPAQIATGTGADPSSS